MVLDEHEYALRRHAIELRHQGVGFKAILERVARSRGWLAKWLQRFAAEGWAGLRSRSRAPQRQHRAIPQDMVDHVLAIRQELEAHRTRRSRFSGIGAETIWLELARRQVRALPSQRTIERILQRHGYPRKPARQPQGGGEPDPAPRATAPGDLHQTDLVGPRYLRGPRGVTRFYSLHTVAVVGRGVATSQDRHKTADFLCTHFVRTWRALGVPRTSQIDNEMAASGGGRYPYALSQVMRLHLLLGVHLVFIPPGEPGRNPHVESFNALWQERVLRHPCPDLRALRRSNAAFLRYYHFRKPHRALRVAEDGTRYPGLWLARYRAALRPLPGGFTLPMYRDPQGRLHLPLARGRVSFIRKVDAQGRIDITGWDYFVGKRLTGRYVTATIFPHRQELVVKYAAHVHKRFPFPVSDPLVDPLLPLSRGRL